MTTDWRDRMCIRRRMLTDGRNLALISEDGESIYISLTKGMVARVDRDDWNLVKECRWSTMTHNHRPDTSKPIHNAATSVYMGKGKHSKIQLLHRLLFGLGPGEEGKVERLLGGGMDFRRRNLRLVPNGTGANRRKQSHWHGRPVSSKYLGVYIMKQKRKTVEDKCYWQARISSGPQRYLGVWPGTDEGEVEAARAYDEAARQMQVEGRCLNFPEVGEVGRNGKIRR